MLQSDVYELTQKDSMQMWKQLMTKAMEIIVSMCFPCW